jgi:hypothetical protein
VFDRTIDFLRRITGRETYEPVSTEPSRDAPTPSAIYAHKSVDVSSLLLNVTDVGPSRLGNINMWRSCVCRSIVDVYGSFH